MKMKSVLTLLMGLFLIIGAQAQKPSLAKAKTLLDQGKLGEAKAMIDAATTYEKTMNDGKTWYYRGLIYAALDTTSNPEFNSLVDNAMQESLTSFKKATELGDPNKEYFSYDRLGLPITMSQQIGGFASHYFNKAINAYEGMNFNESSIFFEKAWLIIPSDTTAISNAAYTAKEDENFERAIELFEKSLALGAKHKDLYYSYIGLLLDKQRPLEALDVVRKAQIIYPEENNLMRQEISILMMTEQIEEAKIELSEAVLREPNDARLRFVLALIYDETGDDETALKEYEKAIALEVDHYESNYNKAVILFERANKLYKEKGLLGYSAADQKKAKEMEPAIRQGFLAALPAWEKVYQIKSNERPTLQTLLFIYAYLGEEKKADKIEAELLALGEEEE